MLDPRIESLAERIKNLEEAISVLAALVDGVAWRVSSEEERRAGIEIHNRIKKILSAKEE